MGKSRFASSNRTNEYVNINWELKRRKKVSAVDPTNFVRLCFVKIRRLKSTITKKASTPSKISNTHSNINWERKNRNETVPAIDPRKLLRLCFVKIHRLKHTIQGKAVTSAKISNTHLNRNWESKNRNELVSAVDPRSLLRKCFVKIRRLRSTILGKTVTCGKISNTLLNRNWESKNRSELVSAVDPRTLLRLCFVKIRRLKSTIKGKTVTSSENIQLKDKCIIDTDFMSYKLKKVIVKLKRMPQVMPPSRQPTPKHFKEATSERQENFDHDEYILTEEKRNCLRKLSLSKMHYNENFSNNKQKEILNKDKKCGSNIKENGENSLSTPTNTRNFVNRTSAIGEILFSNDLVESKKRDKMIVAKSYDPHILTINKLHESCRKSEQVANNSKTIRQAKTKSKRLRQKSNCVSENIITNIQKVPDTEIYEFQSLSGTTDSAAKPKDPAEDIVKKLIAEGKVRVATICKGTGRPKMKREVNKRKKYEIKGKPDKKCAFVNNPARSKEIKGLQNENCPKDAPVDYNLSSNDFSASHGEHNPDDSVGNSRLAHSVFIHQTKKTYSNRRRVPDERQLLEAAKKFISTPLKVNSPPPHTSNFSPIFAPSLSLNKQFESALPWRVNDKTNMPNTFNFSVNSANMPSFSSDYIPPTPTKKHKKNYTQSSILKGRIQNSAAKTIGGTLSSFSLNDTNAENLDPIAVANNCTEICKKDAVLCNFRQQQNPRSGFNCNRRPLKDINVIEVLTLPPWKPVESNNEERVVEKDNSAISICNTSSNCNLYDESKNEESVVEKDNSAISNCNKSNNCNLHVEFNNESVGEKNRAISNCIKSNTCNLFGFEEYFDVNDDEDYTQISPHKSRKNAHSKLKQIKKWRPADEELLYPTSGPISRIFDGYDSKRNQRCIKDMLCSTMINPSKHPVRSSSDEDISGYSKTARAASTNVFNDPDPEITFKEEDPHRTYLPPLKRKRKLRNKFAICLDSDESGEEELHEHDVGRKRHRKFDNQNAAELSSFIKEFNNMCNEAEKYDLVVEEEKN